MSFDVLAWVRENSEGYPLDVEFRGQKRRIYYLPQLASPEFLEAKRLRLDSLRSKRLDQTPIAAPQQNAAAGNLAAAVQAVLSDRSDELERQPFAEQWSILRPLAARYLLVGWRAEDWGLEQGKQDMDPASAQEASEAILLVGPVWKAFLEAIFKDPLAEDVAKAGEGSGRRSSGASGGAAPARKSKKGSKPGTKDTQTS